MTGPLALDQRDLVRRLRDALVAATYTAEKIGEALGTEGEILSRASDIPVQLRQLEQHGTFGALVRLLRPLSSTPRCFRSTSLSR